MQREIDRYITDIKRGLIMSIREELRRRFFTESVSVLERSYRAAASMSYQFYKRGLQKHFAGAAIAGLTSRELASRAMADFKSLFAKATLGRYVGGDLALVFDFTALHPLQREILPLYMRLYTERGTPRARRFRSASLATSKPRFRRMIEESFRRAGLEVVTRFGLSRSRWRPRGSPVARRRAKGAGGIVDLFYFAKAQIIEAPLAERAIMPSRWAEILRPYGWIGRPGLGEQYRPVLGFAIQVPLRRAPHWEILEYGTGVTRIYARGGARQTVMPGRGPVGMPRRGGTAGW